MSAVTRICLGLAIAGFAATAPSYAQTVTQNFNSSETVVINSGLGGWTVDVSGCLFTSNGVASSCYNTSTNTANVEIIATASHGTLSLTFEAAGGGVLETTSSGNLSDLTASIVVTPPSGKFWQATANLVGSSTGGSTDYSRLTASESSIAVSYGTVTGPSSALSNSPTLSSKGFAPSATLSTGVDIRSQGAGVGGSSAGTLTLNSATFTYTVPEPISSSVLVIGLAGLGWARRRRR